MVTEYKNNSNIISDILLFEKMLGIPKKRVKNSPQICQNLREIIMPLRFTTVIRYRDSTHSHIYTHTYTRSICSPISPENCNCKPDFQLSLHLCATVRDCASATESWYVHSTFTKKHKNAINLTNTSIKIVIFIKKITIIDSNLKSTRWLQWYLMIEFSFFFASS